MGVENGQSSPIGSRQLRQPRSEVSHTAPQTSWLRCIADLTGDAILVVDPREGRLIDANRAACRLLGYSRAALLRTALPDIDPAWPQSAQDAVVSLRERETWRRVGSLQTHSGCPVVVEQQVARIVLGQRELLVIAARRPASRDRIESPLPGETQTTLPNRDHLTGLPDRFVLEQRLDRAHRRAALQQATFGALFVDLDDFKRINDGHGHLMGDHVLRVMARRLTNCVRANDCVARFGGDEFVVVLENLDQADEALFIAERLRDAIRSPVHGYDELLMVTASIGIGIGDGTTKPAAVLDAADVAMYRAKRTNGKDTVVGPLSAEGEDRGAVDLLGPRCHEGERSERMLSSSRSAEPFVRRKPLN